MIDPAHPDFQGVPTAGDRPTFTYESVGRTPEPFLTIVTTYAGDRRLFADTARSVQGQSFQEWEWLVTADALRHEEARQAIGEFRDDPRIRFVDDLRHAVAEAPGSFVLQIAAGDLLEPTAAEKWLWFLISHPTALRVDSFRISLADRRLVAGGQTLGSLRVEDRDTWVGVARRGAFLSGSTVGRATLPEYLHWSQRPNGTSDRSVNTSRRRTARLGDERALGLDKLPFSNELAKTMRRLLMIVPWVTTGGADKFTIDLVSQLREGGWEITLVTTLAGDNSWLPRIARLTPDVFALPDFIAPTDYPRFLRYLIESRKPDAVLISNSLFAYRALPYLRRIAHRTAIVDYSHSVVEDWLGGGYPKLSVERQDCLDLQITSSAALKEWMVERGGDARRIDVCYIGTTQDGHKQRPSRAELGLPDEDVIILYPCRITHEKQPAVFAKTLLALHRQNHKFHARVVGDGPYLEWLRTFVRRHALHDSVSFMGYQPNQRVRELMAAADCVFLPSKFEGISAVFYEAMAEGAVVVGADVGGQRELVAPGCGVLVSPGSQKEEVLRYTDVLARLIEDRDGRKKMGASARARISADFTVERMGTRIDALLARAAELAGSTPRSVPTEEEAREAAIEAIRLASWTSSAGGSFGPISWRARHLVFRALSVVGMPMYRLGMRMGAHWLQPFKDRVFRALFPGSRQSAQRGWDAYLSPRKGGVVAPPSFDLVLATFGRTEELARFLRALQAQTYRDFRVIVVDQNADERLAPVLARFEGVLPILRLSSEPGLSRARNVALEHLGADVVAFPDDDCWYPPDLLQRVASVLAEHPEWDGLGGRAVNEVGRPAAGHPDTDAGAMTVFNLWRRVASYTVFLRRRVIDAVGPFDEALGVGSGTKWGGGEDLDYVLRSLRSGCFVHYDPTLSVQHPQKREHSSHPPVRQGYEYGAGFGRVLRKNRLPRWFAAYYFARSFGASGLSLLAGHPRRARFYWAVGRGRVGGWLSGNSKP